MTEVRNSHYPKGCDGGPKEKPQLRFRFHQRGHIHCSLSSKNSFWCYTNGPCWQSFIQKLLEIHTVECWEKLFTRRCLVGDTLL